MQVERDQVRTLLIMAGISIAFALCVWMPLRAKRQRIEAAMVKLDQSMLTDRSTTVGLVAMGEKINHLEHALGQSNKTIPVDTELASLLREWSAELETQQVIDQDILTQPITTGGDYNLIPITLKFRGSFMATFRFLRHVEAMERLIRISNLEMVGNPERPDEPLSIRLNLNTFSMSLAEIQQ